MTTNRTGTPSTLRFERSAVARRLDEPLLVLRSHRDDDFVRRKRCKRVSDRKFDFGFPGNSLHRLTWKLLCGALRNLLGVTECALIVCEPVEDSLSDDGHDDLDPIGVADLVSEGVVGMLDRADDENISHVQGLPKLLTTPNTS